MGLSILSAEYEDNVWAAMKLPAPIEPVINEILSSNVFKKLGITIEDSYVNKSDVGKKMYNSEDEVFIQF